MDVIMSNAIWLFFSLPAWYFPTILSPFAGSYLTAVPATGVVALAIGAILAALHRERAVLWGLLSAAMSQVLVTISGLMHGAVDKPDGPLLVFLAVQLVLVGVMVFKSRKSRLAAALVGWFCLTYAVLAAFSAAMSFSNAWM
jgi:hypothetical protein